jgi:hypothetical protein
VEGADIRFSAACTFVPYLSAAISNLFCVDLAVEPEGVASEPNDVRGTAVASS